MQPDLIEIEQRCYQKQKGLGGSDLFKVAQHYYSQFIGSKDYKNKMANIKKAGFFVDKAFKAGLESVDELCLAKDILTKAVSYMSFPQVFSATLSKITLQWLANSGHANSIIIQTKKVKLDIETGMLVAFSKTDNIDIPYNNTKYIQIFKEGSLFACGLGSDFELSLEVREIESDEPVLTAKEYPKLEQSTSTFKIFVDNSGLHVGDSFNSLYLDEKYTIKMKTGVYKLVLFQLKNSKFVLVTCYTKSLDNSKNEIVEIPNIET